MGNRGFLGILLMVFGVSIILNHYYNIFAELSTWWPMLIILIGIIQIVKRSTSPLAGGIVIVIGALLQARMLDIIPAELLFPIILILFGCWFIFYRFKGKDNKVSEDRLDHFVMFSGLETRNYTQNFTGGSVTALFGGAELDLRDARLSEQGATLELTTIFGGAELSVPEDWKVVVTGTPLFGGWENKTRLKKQIGIEGPVLTVHCLTLFGGAEIKN